MTFEKNNYVPIRCTMDTVTLDVNYVLSADKEAIFAIIMRKYELRRHKQKKRIYSQLIC